MRRVLLDTHTFLWFAFDDPRLSEAAHASLQSKEVIPLVSLANVWETTIKASLGKLDVGGDVIAFFEEETKANSIGLLEIQTTHLRPLSRLPLHHRDPFDRLLIAQCLVEGIPIVSADSAFDAYRSEGLERIW